MAGYDDDAYSYDLSGHKRPRRQLEETNTHGSTPAFLLKTFEIVSNEPLGCVRWSDDGTAIQILDVPTFSEKVLPRYFKHNNFQSFVRQLNMYSFTKTRHDANWREFHHPCFKRGQPQMLSMIKRKTNPVVSRSFAHSGLHSLASPQSFMSHDMDDADWEKQAVDDGANVRTSSVISRVSGAGLAKAAAGDWSPVSASAGMQVPFLKPIIDALGSSTPGPKTAAASDVLSALGISPLAQTAVSPRMGESGAGAMPEAQPTMDQHAHILASMLSDPGSIQQVLSVTSSLLDSYLSVPSSLPSVQPSSPTCANRQLSDRVKDLESQVTSLSLLVHRLVTIISTAALATPAKGPIPQERPAKRPRTRSMADEPTATDGHSDAALVALAEMGSALAECAAEDPTVDAKTFSRIPQTFSGGPTLASLESMAADVSISTAPGKGHARVLARSLHDPSPRMAPTAMLSVLCDSSTPRHARNGVASKEGEPTHAAAIAAHAAAASSMANMMRLNGILSSYKLTALNSPSTAAMEANSPASSRETA